MKISQHQIQTQRQIMAPVMQQSIEVLLLPIMDLEQAIDQELEANPLLEVDESAYEQQKNDEQQDLSTPFSQTISDEIQKLMDAPPHPFLSDNFGDEPTDDNPIKSIQTLEERLLRQLHVDLDDPLKIHIGEMIIGQLDEDGYLTTTCQEITQSLGLDSTEPVEEVLKLIQSYEPVGIACRNLQECLTIQASIQFNGTAPMAIRMIQEHLNNLGRKRYDLIAKDLKITIDHVRSCAQLISTLDPRPARNLRPISIANYIKPDLIITESHDNPNEYQLEVNGKGTRPLRINPIYRQLLRKKNLTPKEKEYLREKLQNALAFIKSIQQRGSTIKEIGQYILDHQKDYFLDGHMALKPLGLKDVAAALGRNESTISRAISQKYIDTPQGLFPLKYFFSQSVGENCFGDGGVSNRSIKEELKSLVDEESKQHPLADNEIQKLLAHKGMKVARRTIGKYRHQLSILPSHLRKT